MYALFPSPFAVTQNPLAPHFNHHHQHLPLFIFLFAGLLWFQNLLSFSFVCCPLSTHSFTFIYTHSEWRFAPVSNATTSAWSNRITRFVATLARFTTTTSCVCARLLFNLIRFAFFKRRKFPLLRFPDTFSLYSMPFHECYSTLIPSLLFFFLSLSTSIDSPFAARTLKLIQFNKK